MLPQFQALKPAAADKLWVGAKRAARMGCRIPKGTRSRRLRATLARGAQPQGCRYKARKGRKGIITMAVFVIDRQGRPLMPCTEKRARLLLARARARVHRVVPFVIRLTDRRAQDSSFQSLRLKLDPGSQTTGIALVQEKADGIAVLNLMELVHRGRQISQALRQRRAFRRRRRGANLRYRAPRFNNRTRAAAGSRQAFSTGSIRRCRGSGASCAGHRCQRCRWNWCALTCRRCRTRTSPVSGINRGSCSLRGT